jgi:TPR repeat protein
MKDSFRETAQTVGIVAAHLEAEKAKRTAERAEEEAAETRNREKQLEAQVESLNAATEQASQDAAAALESANETERKRGEEEDRRNREEEGKKEQENLCYSLEKLLKEATQAQTADPDVFMGKSIKTIKSTIKDFKKLDETFFYRLELKESYANSVNGLAEIFSKMMLQAAQTLAQEKEPDTRKVLRARGQIIDARELFSRMGVSVETLKVQAPLKTVEQTLLRARSCSFLQAIGSLTDASEQWRAFVKFLVEEESFWLDNPLENRAAVKTDEEVFFGQLIDFQKALGPRIGADRAQSGNDEIVKELLDGLFGHRFPTLFEESPRLGVELATTVSVLLERVTNDWLSASQRPVEAFSTANDQKIYVLLGTASTFGLAHKKESGLSEINRVVEAALDQKCEICEAKHNTILSKKPDNFESRVAQAREVGSFCGSLPIPNIPLQTTRWKEFIDHACVSLIEILKPIIEETYRLADKDYLAAKAAAMETSELEQSLMVAKDRLQSANEGNRLAELAQKLHAARKEVPQKALENLDIERNKYPHRTKTGHMIAKICIVPAAIMGLGSLYLLFIMSGVVEGRRVSWGGSVGEVALMFLLFVPVLWTLTYLFASKDRIAKRNELDELRRRFLENSDSSKARAPQRSLFWRIVAPPGTASPRSEAVAEPSLASANARAVGWLLCGFVLCCGLTFLAKREMILATMLVLGAAVLCPPLVGVVGKRHPVIASWPPRIAVAVVLLIVAIIVDTSHNRPVKVAEQSNAERNKRACDGGNAQGCNELGLMCVKGDGVPKDTTEALALFTKACDGGYAAGCFNLGVMYGESVGVSRDSAKAVALFTRACDGGYVRGCFNLAIIYDDGDGVPKDPAKALPLFAKACDGEYTAGCNSLGVMYDKGDGVAKDTTKASALFTKACDGGYANACFNLGVMYDKSDGVSKDLAKALALFTKSCDGRVANGCFNLGLMYAKGVGVRRDSAKAAALYKKACDGGYAAGCKNFGMMNKKTGASLPATAGTTAKGSRQ